MKKHFDKRVNKEISALHEQIKVLRDGISQLSEAMLEEFTQVRHEVH